MVALFAGALVLSISIALMKESTLPAEAEKGVISRWIRGRLRHARHPITFRNVRED